MNIVFIGCGFVADFYIKSVSEHSALKLIGVWDHDDVQLARFSEFYSVKKYTSMDDVLSDESIDLVVNLTNPSSHFTISMQCLEAGMHVYTEKPMAMSVGECKDLLDYANKARLSVFSAPCNFLSESFSALKEMLDQDYVGKLRVVYAEMDDGMVHRMPYKKWLSTSGAPWPYKDEFEVGCTLEHAAYYVAPLVSLFGKVKQVSAFASCQIPDKLTDELVDRVAPDLSIACLVFESGIIARLTCSIIAPHNRELHIIGDEGVLKLRDCWENNSSILLQRRINIRRRTVDLPWVRKSPSLFSVGKSKKGMDFALGLMKLKDELSNGDKLLEMNAFSYHINEVVLAIHNSDKQNGLITINSDI
ncbi:MAG: oxidoreductase [Methylophaga sp.]|nr:MAG: oxidoreductase [Methylophaga sp.]